MLSRQDTFRAPYSFFEDTHCALDTRPVIALCCKFESLFVFQNSCTSYLSLVIVFLLDFVDAHVGDRYLISQTDGAHPFV